MKLVDFVQKGQLQEYCRIWQMQRELSQGLRSKLFDDGYLILVEHSPVFTAGKRARNWTNTPEAIKLREMGAQTVETDRGGLLTFHGPGQLVAYPVVDVSLIGIREYIIKMERILIETCLEMGLRKVERFGEAGVAVDGMRKIGFLGVAHSHGRVTHGASLNVSVDLGWFQQIIPCGHVGLEITNLNDELVDNQLSLQNVKKVYCKIFEDIFGVKLNRIG